jgi:hypothetical protein
VVVVGGDFLDLSSPQKSSRLFFSSVLLFCFFFVLSRHLQSHKSLTKPQGSKPKLSISISNTAALPVTVSPAARGA